MNGSGLAPDRWCTYSAAAMALALRAGEVSSEALVEAHLARIGAVNGELGAFVTVAAETARERARERDKARAEGRLLGPLDAIPFAAKDVFLTAGLRTTAGSAMLVDWRPTRTAAAVQRLEAAGAVLIGKTNTHEFAFGVTTQTCFASTRNPHDRRRLAGGSSGGSAVAVAAGMVPMALGTDTAGSIRLPASWTGTVGFKPSYGRVSCEGVIAQSYSADHVGPLTRTAVDAALMMATIAELPTPDYLGAVLRPPPLSEIVVGVPDPWPAGAIAEEIQTEVNGVLDQVAAAGGGVVSVRIPLFASSLQINSDVILPETAAQHAMYQEEWFKGRRPDYGSDVAELLQRGGKVPATAFIKAQGLRRELKRQMEAALARVTILATPAVPFPAPLIGTTEVAIDGQKEEMLPAAIRYLCAFSLAGLPAISIPIGRTGSNLPVGLQLIAGRDKEPYLLATAARLLREQDEIGQCGRLMNVGDD